MTRQLDIKQKIKPRKLDDEMIQPEPFNLVLHNVTTSGGAGGINLEGLNVHATNLGIYNTPKPLRIRGGSRHYFRNLDIQRIKPRTF